MNGATATESSRSKPIIAGGVTQMLQRRYKIYIHVGTSNETNPVCDKLLFAIDIVYLLFFIISMVFSNTSSFPCFIPFMVGSTQISGTIPIR